MTKAKGALWPACRWHRSAHHGILQAGEPACLQVSLRALWALRPPWAIGTRAPGHLTFAIAEMPPYPLLALAATLRSQQRRHERACVMMNPDTRRNLAPGAGLDLRYYSEEAARDWYKTNIPCQVGCPAHTDVANYIGLISQGRFDDAYLLNRQCNVVPGVLGRTCARPCEPVCRRNKIDGNQ